MKYNFLLIVILNLFLLGCETSNIKTIKKIDLEFDDKYKNIGFALIYNDTLKDIKRLDNRSLDIYHNSLKRKSVVKITNPENGKFLIAQVKSNKVKFSKFYNSVLTKRIAEILELNLKEPYVEILLTSKESTYIAKKAKTFEEESTVADKAPIDGVQINDLNLKKENKKKTNDKVFLYSIKVADFYYRNTAELMIDRIKKETSLKNLRIIKISSTKFRVLIGPFNDIKSLKDSYEKMNFFNFENLEILKNV